MDIEELRKEIDNINSEIVRLISKRNKVVKKIGDYKKNKGLEIYDSKREIEILKKIKLLAKKEGLNEKFILRIFKEILKNSKELQKD